MTRSRSQSPSANKRKRKRSALQNESSRNEEALATDKAQKKAQKTARAEQRKRNIDDARTVERSGDTDEVRQLKGIPYPDSILKLLSFCLIVITTSSPFSEKCRGGSPATRKC